MSLPEHRTSQEFFEQKYREADDPWHFATSAYEQERYETILHALGPRFFERAFEPGCSIGVLTEGLSHRCGRVEAMDTSATAVSRARERCSSLENVTIQLGSLRSFPAGISGNFDLIIFCEIGYYFDGVTLAALARALISRLEHGGVFLAAHWLGVSADHILSGDRVHEILGEMPGVTHAAAQRHEHFRMDKWTRT